MNLSLREANLSDAEIILEWRNDALTRQHSFHKEPIDAQSHLKWYRDRLSDENSFLYILLDESERVGQLRIDRVNDVGEISYMIAPDKRNRGYGKEIIALSESVVPKGIKALTGLVETANEASKKCFRHNRYAEFSAGDVTCFIKCVTVMELLWNPTGKV